MPLLMEDERDAVTYLLEHIEGIEPRIAVDLKSTFRPCVSLLSMSSIRLRRYSDQHSCVTATTAIATNQYVVYISTRFGWNGHSRFT